MSSLSYFQRRLAHAQQASDLPASARFDVALSDLDDDNAEYLYSQFGGPEYQAGGFGMSDVLKEFVSRDPAFAKVSDLASYQQNLKDTGYLPESYPVTGSWDDTSHTASRQAERDAFDLIRSGAHLGSVTAQKGLGYLAAAVPQAVFKGVVGAAVGLAKSAADVATNPVQAVEEAGLAGGAVSGAIVGATVGGPIGALIGGAAGGVIGLAADFFGDDEGEEGQSLAQNLWDSLSPYDEYKQSGAKHFFSLLDVVSLAATFLKAGAIGVKGVQAALKAPSLAAPSIAPTAIGARTAGGMVLPTVIEQSTKSVAKAGFREALMRAAPSQVGPGLAARMTTAALKRPVIGGAAIGGLAEAAPDLLHGEWGDALTSGLVGAGVGAVTLGVGSKTKAGEAAIARSLKMLEAAPLQRIVQSGAGQVVRAAYTGFAVASTGGRIIADITPGEDATEKGIQEAPDWGRAGDVIDLTVGTLLYPSRILPLHPREIGDAFRALDNPAALMPILRAESKRLGVPINDELVLKVKTQLGHGDPSDSPQIQANIARIYQNKAYNDEAARIAQSVGARSVSASVPKTVQVGGYVRAADRENFGRVVGIEGSRARVHFINRAEGSQATVVLPIDSLTPTRAPVEARALPTSIEGRFELAATEREVRARLIARDLKEAETGPSPNASQLFEDSLNRPLSLQNHIETWQGRNTTLDDLVEEGKAQDLLDALAPEGEFRVMPAVRGQFLTNQSVTKIKDRYTAAVKGYRDAKKLLDANPDNALLQSQADNAYQELDSVVTEMRNTELIVQDEVAALHSETVNGAVTKRLDKIAKMQPPENEQLSDKLLEAGLDRYIAVNTGENMLVTADIPKLLHYEGLDQVSLHPVREFFAALARRPDDYKELGPMRYWSIAAQLEQAGTDLDLGLKGKQMADTIYDFTRNRSDRSWAEKHLGQIVSENRTGTIIRRTDQATGKVRRELLKVEGRDLSLEDINQAFGLDKLAHIDDPYEAADKIKRAFHVGAAFGADMMHPLASLRELGRALKLEGLPAFQDYARTVRLPLHRWISDDMTENAFFARAKKGDWGYVPAKLRRAHLALQFTFSPAFDISRYLEAMSFGAKHGIPPRLVIAPRKYIHNYKDGFIDPLTGDRVSKIDAVTAMDRFADVAIYGRDSMQSLDDLQYRVHNAGFMGFKPKEVESAQLMVLAQRWAKKGPLSARDVEEIRENLLMINRYGKGQSALAKSAHFVFFPFLFQAKQLNLIQDFALGAPTRTALLHEGFRRWNGINEDEGLKEDFSKLVEKHLPVIQEFARWNNISYGIGAGRFFLEGLVDQTSVDGRAALDRSTFGKITQGLTQFLLPGGIHSPVGESAGQMMDAAKHLFVPVVVYDDGEKVSAFKEFSKIFERMVPVYRDVQRWIDQNQGVGREQLATLFDPSHTTGQAQLTGYIDNRKLVKQTFESIAAAAGYASWDSLRQSDAGAEFAQVYDKAQDLLVQEFPRGAELSARFIDTSEVKDQAMVAIATKDNRTDAEQAILGLGRVEEQLKTLAAERGVSQETMLKTAAPMIRQFALKYADDRQ